MWRLKSVLVVELFGVACIGTTCAPARQAGPTIPNSLDAAGTVSAADDGAPAALLQDAGQSDLNDTACLTVGRIEQRGDTLGGEVVVVGYYTEEGSSQVVVLTDNRGEALLRLRVHGPV